MVRRRERDGAPLIDARMVSDFHVKVHGSKQISFMFAANPMSSSTYSTVRK